MKEVKVSINDLISAANYSVEETTVPPYDKIVENFSSTWKELYLFNLSLIMMLNVTL